jgi:hypothetical protein
MGHLEAMLHYEIPIADSTYKGAILEFAVYSARAKFF